jgi:phosphatidylserine/phosphatidylglycerophosphate/cardiolipin synthase-like enzyme
VTAPSLAASPVAHRNRESGRWWALAVLVALLLVGAVVVTLLPIRRESAAPPPSGPAPVHREVVGVFVEPDDGRAPILDEIAAARREITLHIYLVSDDATIDALAAAAQRGVRVRVLLEEHPYGGGGGQPETFARLAAAGIDTRWANPAFRFNHVKTFTIDGATAIIMNQNLTRSAFEQNRELGIVTTRPADVAAALALFETDWARGPEPDAGPLVVSPTNSRKSLLGLINGAETSLDIYAEVIRDPEFVAALADAAERGVIVRIVMSPGDERQLTTLRELVAAGVGVRLVTDLYIHAKLFLADNVRAFIGSQNMTATSLDQNREIGLVVDDPAGIARIGRAFDADWRLGQELSSP